MEYKNILLENREDDFKEKYSKNFTKEQLDKITDNIAPKYLDWTGKVLGSINFDENFPLIVDAINSFQKIYSNLPVTDLNQYKNPGQLFNALSEYQNRQRRQIKKVEGGNVVYEDDKFFVVNPLTHNSSCYYGKGTKWCTAAESDTHFNRYNEDGKLFYILNKTLPTSDKLYKVALLQKFDGDKSYWDAKDDTIKSGWIFDTNEFNEISSAITDYLNSEYAEQLRIYKDKELAKKEKERLERLRVEATLRERYEESEERRTEGEWDLGPDCPEEGLKAHALLNWLVDTSDVQILTNEDRIELQRLKDEIERLEVEYDADEEVRTDLLDDISDLGDEIDEFDDRIDVYNIIPTGIRYYDTTEFVLINSPVDGRTYAVGDEDEIKSSCYDSVESLIDDVGYDGFSKGFASNYIDNEAIASYAEDVYDDDVRNNPDSYFSDEDRNLSDKQQEEIEILRNRIEQTQTLIERLEGEMDGGEDDDEIQDKVDEMTDLIEEMETEITEIEEDPQGDFPEDMIQDKIDELVNDVNQDPEEFVETFGLDLNEYINKDDFIEGVIDSDGYGNTLNHYDGNVDEVYINETLFYVMRID